MKFREYIKEANEMFVWATGKSTGQKGNDIVIYQDLERLEIKNGKMKSLGKVNIKDMTDQKGKSITSIKRMGDDIIMYKNQKYTPLGMNNKFNNGEKWDH
jgi:hypothetical protein